MPGAESLHPEHDPKTGIELIRQCRLSTGAGTLVVTASRIHIVVDRMAIRSLDRTGFKHSVGAAAVKEVTWLQDDDDDTWLFESEPAVTRSRPWQPKA
ncbi:MAG: hypothetical protein ABSA49_06390 [Rhizomicrobium sp.]